jgi:hypothetical protein
LRLHRNIYLLLGVNFSFGLANLLQVNRWVIVGILAVGCVVLLRVLWGIGNEARGWCDLGHAYLRYVSGNTRKGRNQRGAHARETTRGAGAVQSSGAPALGNGHTGRGRDGVANAPKARS